MSDDSPSPLDRLAEDGFRANAFEPTHEGMYRELFGTLLEELEARPGFGTLHRMLAERAAHSFVLLKARDARPDGVALNWQDYERLNKIFMGAVDRLFTEAKLTDADASAKRQIARAVTATVVDVIERLPLTTDDRTKALRALRAQLEEHLVTA